MPVPHRVRDRQDRFLAGERLADDAGEEARRRLVRLARAHADGRQTQADAVEDAAPAVVGEQQLADRLLRAVAGERRVQELVADRLGEGRAEHRDRRCEYHAWLVAAALLANRLEQPMRALEVDAVALVEVGLGLAGDDSGEVEDGAGTGGDQLLGLARRGKVGDDAARAGGDDVVQDQFVLTAEPLAQLAADHARRAGDERLHQFGSQMRHQGTSGRTTLPERNLLSGKLATMTRVASSRSAFMPSAS